MLTSVAPSVTAPARARRDLWRLAPLAVFVVAAALRLGEVLRSNGGPGGDVGYDPSVYYSASDALLHGRLPYADFVLLHPPLLMLVLTPFAGLGMATTDHTGLVVADTAFSLLGALTAAGVTVLCSRIGLGRRGAITAGLFYAVWWGAILPEVEIRLEPLSGAAFCGALLLLLDRHGPTGRGRRAFAAGVLLGLAVSTKIWWAAPVVVVLAWLWLRRGPRPAARWTTLGVVAAGVAVNLPFFVLAPRPMWHMVVLDQLDRPQLKRHPAVRLNLLSSASDALPHLHAPASELAAAVAVVLAVGVAVTAWRCRPARLLVVVAAVQIVVLAASPSYFSYYSGYVAVAFAVCVGAAAAARLPGRVVPGVARTLPLGLTAVLTAAAMTVHGAGTIQRFPGRRLTATTAHVHCLMADSPIALIEANHLSSDLARGCPDWVDVTGRTYGADRSSGPRYRNRRWQTAITRYLRSGNAFVLVRANTGLSAATSRSLRSDRVVGRAGRVTVYSSVSGPRTAPGRGYRRRAGRSDRAA